MFMGRKPVFGQRISLENLRPGDRERFCNDRNIIYEYEKELIEKNLKDEISDIIRNFFESLTVETIKRDIISLIDTLKKEVKNLTEDVILDNLKQKYFKEIKEMKVSEVFRKIENYTKLDVDTRKMQDLEKLYSHNKSTLCRKSATLWLLLFILGAIVETVVLLIQALLSGEGFNPVIFIYGGLLAAGSFLLGRGFAAFEILRKYKKVGIYTEQEMGLPNIPAFITVGILLILFVSVIRAWGEEFFMGIFFFTILLGITVSLFEFMHFRTKKMIEDAIELLYIERKKYATEQHNKTKSKLVDLYDQITREEFDLAFSDYIEKQYKDYIHSEITNSNKYNGGSK
jgi:hypothetical protein